MTYFSKVLTLLTVPNKWHRLRALFEIRLNHLLFASQPSHINVISFDQFLDYLQKDNLYLLDILQPNGAAETALKSFRSSFERLALQKAPLPFPPFYNADKSFALLSYGFARHLTPRLVLETGVGYGITSALVLQALEHNDVGKLISIDLPALSDPQGSCTGIVVPVSLREKRWHLHLGPSREWLPAILKNLDRICLFISDSANVYTLQRYEFETVFPIMSQRGVMLFNNISSNFQVFLKSVKEIEFHQIWQLEKRSCITAVVIKK